MVDKSGFDLGKWVNEQRRKEADRFLSSPRIMAVDGAKEDSETQPAGQRLILHREYHIEMDCPHCGAQVAIYVTRWDFWRLSKERKLAFREARCIRCKGRLGKTGLAPTLSVNYAYVPGKNAYRAVMHSEKNDLEAFEISLTGSCWIQSGCHPSPAASK